MIATAPRRTPKFDFSSTVVLANLYYDFNRGGRFIPYIGGGIGFAHNETALVPLQRIAVANEQSVEAPAIVSRQRPWPVFPGRSAVVKRLMSAA